MHNATIDRNNKVVAAHVNDNLHKITVVLANVKAKSVVWAACSIQKKRKAICVRNRRYKPGKCRRCIFALLSKCGPFAVNV